MIPGDWAGPLNLEQRRALAGKLVRAVVSFSLASQVPGKGRRSLVSFDEARAEMSGLHRDVTGRLP